MIRPDDILDCAVEKLFHSRSQHEKQSGLSVPFAYQFFSYAADLNWLLPSALVLDGWSVSPPRLKRQCVRHFSHPEQYMDNAFYTNVFQILFALSKCLHINFPDVICFVFFFSFVLHSSNYNRCRYGKSSAIQHLLPHFLRGSCTFCKRLKSWNASYQILLFESGTPCVEMPL